MRHSRKAPPLSPRQRRDEGLTPIDHHSPPPPPSPFPFSRLVEALDAYDTRDGAPGAAGGDGDFDFGGAGDGYGAGLDSLGGDGYTGHPDDDGYGAYDDYDDYGGDDFLATGGGGGKGKRRYRMVSDDEEEDGVEYVPAPYTADGTVVE